MRSRKSFCIYSAIVFVALFHFFVVGRDIYYINKINHVLSGNNEHKTESVRFYDKYRKKFGEINKCPLPSRIIWKDARSKVRFVDTARELPLDKRTRRSIRIFLDSFSEIKHKYGFVLELPNLEFSDEEIYYRELKKLLEVYDKL